MLENREDGCIRPRSLSSRFHLALLLSTQTIAKSYGAAPLFKNISLSIQDGDRLGVIGPNGSGTGPGGTAMGLQFVPATVTVQP